jgi:hypothetical protein
MPKLFRRAVNVSVCFYCRNRIPDGAYHEQNVMNARCILKWRDPSSSVENIVVNHAPEAG